MRLWSLTPKEYPYPYCSDSGGSSRRDVRCPVLGRPSSSCGLLLAYGRKPIRDWSPTTISVGEDGLYFYAAMPAVFPLKGNVAVELESAITERADFYVMGFEGPLAENSSSSKVRKVESGGVFRF